MNKIKLFKGLERVCKIGFLSGLLLIAGSSIIKQKNQDAYIYGGAGVVALSGLGWSYFSKKKEKPLDKDYHLELTERSEKENYEKGNKNG